MTLHPIGCYTEARLKTEEEKEMNTGLTIRAGAAGSSRQEFKAQAAEYLAQQPAAKQALHKWMKALEVASLTIIAAWFALALYVSINHTAFAGTAIAAAWFAFPVSVVPLMILQGLHTVVLRASVPSFLPGTSRFVTGSRAMWSGLGLIATAVAAGAFWGVLAWAVWSFDVALIGSYMRILGAVLGIVLPAAILLGLVSGVYRQFARPR
jgi:hypothetical protein